jgi:hypothetical protein
MGMESMRVGSMGVGNAIHQKSVKKTYGQLVDLAGLFLT